MFEAPFLWLVFSLMSSVKHFLLLQRVLASSFGSLCCPIHRPAFISGSLRFKSNSNVKQSPSLSFTVVLLHKDICSFLKDTLTHRPPWDTMVFHQCFSDWELVRFFGGLCCGLYSCNDLTMEIYITWDLPNIACTDEKRYIYLPLYFSKTTTDTEYRLLRVMSQLY